MRRRLLIFGLAALLAGPAIGQPAGLRPSVEAARLANEAAGIAVAKFGPAVVTPAELLRGINASAQV